MTPEEIQEIMPEGYGGDWELTCQGENIYMNFGLRLDEILQEFAMVEQQIDYELEVGAIQEETFDTRDTLARDQAKQAITSLIKELVVDIDTDVDIPEALKKIYNDGYSNGYNDRTYENSYNSVDFRMAEAIAPAVAKVRSRYDKQLKVLEEV